VGPTLFTEDGQGVIGLAVRRPDPLVDLPGFSTDDLDPARTGGALCIQACADDVQVAFHAVRELMRLGHGLVSVRWSQAGFLPLVGPGVTPRNLLGFKDGTNNVRDARDLSRFVWVGTEGPPWIRGGPTSSRAASTSGSTGGTARPWRNRSASSGAGRAPGRR